MMEKPLGVVMVPMTVCTERVDWYGVGFWENASLIFSSEPFLCGPVAVSIILRKART
jgi:hypothetical protein